MTANQTPRLSLMDPVDSDKFESSDFSDTFTKLDNTPGFSYVANYGSLPTNLTASQHGSVYQQLDTGVLWRWVQPSNGSPGAWARINSYGLLTTIATQTGNISTTTTSFTSAPVLATATFTNPGKRSLLIIVTPAAITNTNTITPIASIGVFLNNVQVAGGSFLSYNSAFGSGSSVVALIPQTTLAPNSTGNVANVKLRSSSAGGTSTSTAGLQLGVYEL